MKIKMTLLVGMILAMLVSPVAASAAAPQDVSTFLGQVKYFEEDSLTIETRNGEEVFEVDSSTHIHIQGSENPSIDDIEPGDNVMVRAEGEGPDRVARRIVLLPENLALRGIVHGEVSSVDQDSFQILTPRGEKAIRIHEETLFRIPGVEDPSLYDLSEGDLAAVFGRWGAGGEILARRVVVLPPKVRELDRVRGRVIRVEGELFSLETRQGVVEVVTDEGTRFRGVASLDEIQGGQLAVALGEAMDDGFCARAVVILPEEAGSPRILRIQVEQVGEAHLVLRSGERELQVQIDDETRLRIREGEEVDLADIEVGDQLAVLVLRLGETLKAKWVAVISK